MGVSVRHHIPGRTRLRIDPWPGEAGIERARRLLSRRGCTLASPRAAIGSVLVTHDRGIAADRLTEWIAAALAGEQAAPAGPDPLDEAMTADTRAALHRLDSREEGLSGEEAVERLGRYGANALPAPQVRSKAEILTAQMTTLPVGLLLGSAVLSLATGGLFDAVVTVAVVGANAAIGYSSEEATERLIRRLSRPIEHLAEVWRDGERRTIAAREVVPGDIVALAPGTMVPADARLIEARGLTVDESALTGESLPVEKTADALDRPAEAVADRANIVHRGTVVTGGDGCALVLRTGAETEMARTHALIGAARPPRPPSEEKLAAMGRGLALGCLGISGATFAIGLLRGEPIVQIARGAIALAVAAIPESLPTISTTTLAYGARALEGDRVFVRALPAVEALGTVDTICLDKTGTLTENRMRVVAVHAGGTLRRMPASGDWPRASVGDLDALAQAIVLCNEASLADGTGSATEIALLRFAQAAGVDPDALQRRAPIEALRNRDVRHRWMASGHRIDGELLVALKGSPDELLERADRERAGGTSRPLTAARRRAIRAANHALAGEGLRVLGVARRGGAIQDHIAGIEWLGLVALADPVRTEAGEAIGVLHRAGVRTVMITGDQPATALSVAEALALSRTGILNVAEGPEIAGLDRAALGELAQRTSVFARVSPGDKLRIVEALQHAGRRVAMIGDGINDGPALRAAAVGVAMGRQGTDVAREVADIVIADDDLRALALAIARGRATSDGMHQAVRYLLATNLSEVLVMIAETLRGGGEMETPMELFWLNLATDTLPALGLALSPSAAAAMNRPPGDPAAPLFDREELRAIGGDGVSMAAAALATHFLAVARRGPGPGARGATFLALSLAQIGHVLARRERGGFGRLEAGTASALGLLAAPFAIGPLRRILGIGLPSPGEALLGAGFAVAASAISRRKQGR